VAGIVYVLSNPAMPGLFKIGMTDKTNLALRMKELYTTGVPLPFDCVYACIVEDNAVTEKAMHSKFAKYRINQNREFFKVGAKSVVKALKKYELQDITTCFRMDFDSTLLEEEKDARRSARRKLARIDPTVTEAKGLHAEFSSKK
jgi:hypothetical protein